MAIADHPEVKTYNPMFIFGSTGVGKTHLIQAIGIRIKEQNPRARVLYVPARVFESQYTSAVPKGKVNDFINFYQSIDVLLIDDIHELAGKTGTQNTFFHIFNHLHQHGKQLIMTSDRRPVDMDGMVPRLISRFKWGMTVELEKPDYDLRRNVLIKRAAQDGLTLTDDVLDFIATQVTDSVRDLEGVVVSLLAHATMLNQDITLELAQSVASNTVHVSQHQLTFELIAEAVASFYNLDTDLLFGKSRKREISDARQVLMYFAKTRTQLSSTNIGLRLSRNHATVLHACKQVEQRMGIERKFCDGYTTVLDHMPERHREYQRRSRQYNAGYFMEKARQIGPSVEDAMQAILDSKPFLQQSYKACQGILLRLEKVCSMLEDKRAANYSRIRRMLESNRDLMADEEIPATQGYMPGNDDVRGPEAYQ